MENYFDFYVIVAYSDSKRAIKKIPNLDESEIVRSIDYKDLNNGKWPKISYIARMAFVDVLGNSESAKQRVDEILSSLPKIEGVQYQTKYIVRD